MDKQTAIASARNDACFCRMEESWVTTTGLAEDNGEGRPALSGRAKEAVVGREIGAGTRPTDLAPGFSTILSRFSPAGSCLSDSAQKHLK
jgi:hypothetical protein